MKQKRMTLVAVGCGLACAICVAAFMASVQGEANAARAEALARYGGEQVEVCVATRDIASGERLDLSAVETKLWVADLLPDGALRETSDAVGKTATSSILKGEVITSKRFERDRDSLDVPVGKEAVSVPAKEVQAVGGAIRPGMSVDVYSSGASSTSAIARNVLVIDTSVGESASLVSSSSGWITLAVDPEHVEEVVSAANKTELYFVLPGETPEEAAQRQAQSGSASAASAGAEGSGGSASAEKTGRSGSAAAGSSTAAGKDGAEGGDSQ